MVTLPRERAFDEDEGAHRYGPPGPGGAEDGGDAGGAAVGGGVESGGDAAGGRVVVVLRLPLPDDRRWLLADGDEPKRQPLRNGLPCPMMICGYRRGFGHSGNWATGSTE